MCSGDEVAYREEVLKLATWCSENNLALNTKKTKEIIVDFRRHSTDLAPLYINGECVERVHTFRFLGVFISDNISWTVNTTAIIKKAQQRLYFLRVLRKHNLGSSLLLTFYRVSIESLLTYCITVWYGSCTMADRERLQRVVKAAQKIIGCPLPSLLDIYTSRCLSRAENIIKHSSHPASDLFNLLPSGRRYSCHESPPRWVCLSPSLPSGPNSMSLLPAWCNAWSLDLLAVAMRALPGGCSFLPACLVRALSVGPPYLLPTSEAYPSDATSLDLLSDVSRVLLTGHPKPRIPTSTAGKAYPPVASKQEYVGSSGLPTWRLLDC
ncbi:RNA-directed DNA polymerase from mobile element jockey-like protein [Labeo rohita]|uniref:RNA-directed DNA polymerase from mobile element jockey-like protein n=1 Tax=Labeo rohita TaxID=84645 RepID=A0A498MPU8_LABRO|nr:RNA-directed DNA polymerase from mobile element jockey-like protein [Labeo rohita]